MNIILNGEQRLLPARLTVAGLVDALGLPTRGSAVAVDQVIVPRSRWASELVSPGANVEVVTPMQGG